MERYSYSQNKKGVYTERRKKAFEVALKYSEEMKKGFASLSSDLSVYKAPNDTRETMVASFPLLSAAIRVYCRKTKMEYSYIAAVVNSCPISELKWEERGKVMNDLQEIIRNDCKKVARNPNNFEEKNKTRLMPVVDCALGMISRRKYNLWIKNNPYDVYNFKLLAGFKKKETTLFNNSAGKCSQKRRDDKKLQIVELLDILEFTIKMCI